MDFRLDQCKANTWHLKLKLFKVMPDDFSFVLYLTNSSSSQHWMWFHNNHNSWIWCCGNAESNRPHIISIMFFFFLSPLTLICWLSPCRERLVSSLITDCLCTFFFWTPLQQTSHPFNQQHVSALLVLFTVFIARVYATCFLLCCGSMPNCSMIGPYDKRW